MEKKMKINLDKTLVIVYRDSLNRSSNFVSNVLLDKVLRKHSQQITENSIDVILSEANELVPGVKRSNIETWKSCSKQFDESIANFKYSLPQCEKCSLMDQNLNEFANNMCKCNISFKTEDKCMKLTKSQILDNDSYRVSKPTFTRNKSQNKFCVMSSRDFDNFNQESVDEKLESENNKVHKSLTAKLTFKTAKEQLLGSNPAAKRTLGTSRKAQGRFIPPMLGAQEKQEETNEGSASDDRLKLLDPKMIELIESEIIDKGVSIGWDDIAGLQMAKSVIQEAVVWPLLRPDIFTGLRRPPKGVLLFGPPGTGKTLIGRCVAAQCNATFFGISASSLTSKWIGDGEKMVRALFAVARTRQPAVVFIDEIDSLLSQRSDGEHEATRRIKTEFLVQFDGAATGEDDRILIVGATNRPQELDEAARRRLVKRLYIPLPDLQARQQIVTNLLKTEAHALSAADVAQVASLTDGFSGADMKSLCSEAAMGPIRSFPMSQIVNIDRNKVRPVNVEDFKTALQRVRPSVSPDDLGQYIKWNSTYGQGF